MYAEKCPYCGALADLSGAPPHCPDCGRALPELDPAQAVIDIRAEGAEADEAQDADVVRAEPVFEDEGYGPSAAYGPRGPVRVFRYEGNYRDQSGCCCGLGCFLAAVLLALALQGLASLF